MARTPLTGWKATAAVSMSNYIDSGSIIAIATSLGFWGKAYFPDDDGTIAGLLAAFSANAFGAAIGALIGGPLCDKYGRKFIYTYDLLLYALGGLVVVFTTNLAMLFAGFIIIGLAVGASVPAGWTYIAEFAPTNQRGRHIGATQLAWSFGPFIGFGLAAALTPLGLLGSRIIFAHLVVIALTTWYIRRGLEESETWEAAKGGADAKPPSMWASFRKLFNRRVNITAPGVPRGHLHMLEPGGLTERDLPAHDPQLHGLRDFADRPVLHALLGLRHRLHVHLHGPGRPDPLPLALPGGRTARHRVLDHPGLRPVRRRLDRFRLHDHLGPLSRSVSAGLLLRVVSRAVRDPVPLGGPGIVFFVVRLASGLISLIFPVILARPGGLLIDGVILIGFLVVATAVGTIGAPRTQGKSLEEIEIERYGERVINA